MMVTKVQHSNIRREGIFFELMSAMQRGMVGSAVKMLILQSKRCCERLSLNPKESVWQIVMVFIAWFYSRRVANDVTVYHEWR